MNIKNPNWKRDRIASLEESIEFLGNKSKYQREKWVVERLLSALGINYNDADFARGDEPADVSFGGSHFQVKEVMNKERKRSKEYKEKLEKAKVANNFNDLTEHYSPMDISFTEIVKLCINYAESLIKIKKYGLQERKRMNLICYFNYKDCNEVPPIEIGNENDGFRSLSVVSNRFCAVVYASSGAPQFLIDAKGQVVDFPHVYK